MGPPKKNKNFTTNRSKGVLNCRSNLQNTIMLVFGEDLCVIFEFEGKKKEKKKGNKYQQERGEQGRNEDNSN